LDGEEEGPRRCRVIYEDRNLFETAVAAGWVDGPHDRAGGNLSARVRGLFPSPCRDHDLRLCLFPCPVLVDVSLTANVPIDLAGGG
jgi:hypothetical protein